MTEARKGVDTDPTFKQREETKAMIDSPEQAILAEQRAARLDELQGFIDARTPARRRDWVKKNFNVDDNDVARGMVKDLRGEVAVLNRETKKREALQPRLDRLSQAKETARVEGEKFIAEEAAPVRRFTAGASLDRPGKTATNEMMSASQKRMAGVIEGDDSVVMGKATSGIGRYIDPKGETFDERALDFEYVARQDHNPDEVITQLVQEAKDAKQESVFFSEAVRPNTVEGANPGMEIYFNRKLGQRDVRNLTKILNKLKVDTGFTFATDFRLAEKVAGGADTGSYVGLRMIYIPEFGGGQKGAQAVIDRINTVKETLLKKLDYIASADYLEYDTKVFFEGDYDAVLAGSL